MMPTPTEQPASLQGGWPFADKKVLVQGRQMSAEVLVVAAVYAACGLWLLIAMRELLSLVPDLLSGLFDESAFLFAFSWLFLYVVSILLYLVFGLLAIAYLVFRVDPLGRGLTVVVAANLVAMIATSEEGVPGDLMIITLASVACAVVLFASPWVRRSFSESPRRRGQPAPVVLALTVAVVFYSLLAWVVVMGVSGLRFAGELGSEWVIMLFAHAGATVLALAGYRRVRKAADRTGRKLLTAGCAVTLLGAIVGGDNSGSVAFLVSVIAAIVIPLWFAPTSREWFGDSPLQSAQQAPS